MELFLYSFNIVIPIFLYLLLGMILKFFKLIDNQFVKIINKFSFRVTIPILLFYNIYQSNFKSIINLNFILFICFILPLIFFILALIVHFSIQDDPTKASIIQCFIRANQTLFAIPLMQSIYGDHSLGLVSIMCAITIPLTNILSVLVLTFYNKDATLNFKTLFINTLKNPIMIAIIIGFFFQFTKIQLPSPLFDLVKNMAFLSTPLALISLGGNIELKKLKTNFLYLSFGTILRLIILPTLVILTAYLLGFRGIELGGLLCVAAAPCAVSTYQLAVELKGNGELSGQLVVSTTLFSTLTLFLFITLFRFWGIM